ncbi:hypothetical protein JL721_10927 [Aureococcus anophagefferens]|nr:hypothetical protein JL721_10927 [Aureococcus anophagefferens]
MRRAGQRRHFAGHSKWANIRKKKGGLDAARGDLFAKLSRNVEVASRVAKGDRSSIGLASAISRAKDQRLPKKTLEAAIARGAEGKAAGADVEQLTYEGTLPGGVGVVVDALTDNKNRTANDVRSIFRKHGGALGAQNSVAWAWARVGELRVEAAARDGDGAPAAAFDAAAYEALFGGAEAARTTDPASAAAVRDALAAAGLHVAATELVWRPATDVDVGDADAVGGALVALEDHPDVAAVFSNAKFPDA